MVHRFGTVSFDSPADISFKKACEIIGHLLTTGPILHSKCPTYAFSTALAHFLQPWLRIDGKWLIAVLPVAEKDSAADISQAAVPDVMLAPASDVTQNEVVTTIRDDEQFPDAYELVADEYCGHGALMAQRGCGMSEIH